MKPWYYQWKWVYQHQQIDRDFEPGRRNEYNRFVSRSRRKRIKKMRDISCRNNPNRLAEGRTTVYEWADQRIMWYPCVTYEQPTGGCPWANVGTPTVIYQWNSGMRMIIPESFGVLSGNAGKKCPRLAAETSLRGTFRQPKGGEWETMTAEVRIM